MNCNNSYSLSKILPDRTRVTFYATTSKVLFQGKAAAQHTQLFAAFCSQQGTLLLPQNPPKTRPKKRELCNSQESMPAFKTALLHFITNWTESSSTTPKETEDKSVQTDPNTTPTANAADLCTTTDAQFPPNSIK